MNVCVADERQTVFFCDEVRVFIKLHSFRCLRKLYLGINTYVAQKLERQLRYPNHPIESTFVLA